MYKSFALCYRYVYVLYSILIKFLEPQSFNRITIPYNLHTYEKMLYTVSILLAQKLL